MKEKCIKKLAQMIAIVFGTLAIVILLAVALYSFSKYIKKDKVANIFGYAFMTVESNSMQPTFEYGDKLLVKLDSPYVEGDIITYAIDDIFITHRVVDIVGDKIITKGDYADVMDEPINSKQVIGVVIKIFD